MPGGGIIQVWIKGLLASRRPTVHLPGWFHRRGADFPAIQWSFLDIRSWLQLRVQRRFLTGFPFKSAVNIEKRFHLCQGKNIVVEIIFLLLAFRYSRICATLFFGD